MRVLYLVVLAGSLFTMPALAHKSHEQSGKIAPSGSMRVEKEKSAVIDRINESYAAKVRPIFQKKCMDCHGGKTEYPWYHKIPGIKQMIDQDVAEAQEHLDFRPGFPFKSHATPKEDLDAIEETTRDGSMPPFRYRLMHPSTALTNDERNAILDWVASSKQELARPTSP